MIFKSYNPVTLPIKDSRVKGIEGKFPLHSMINALRDRSVANISMPLYDGEMTVRKGLGVKTVYVDASCNLPDALVDGFANTLASEVHSKSNFNHGRGSKRLAELTFSRHVQSNGNGLTYQAYYDQEHKMLRVRMPKSIVARSSGSIVNGYDFAKVGKDEREQLYEEVLLPIHEDVKELGFSPRTTRFNAPCMTTVCFEPRAMDSNELGELTARMIRRGDVGIDYFVKSSGRGIAGYDRSQINVKFEPKSPLRLDFFDDDFVNVEDFKDLMNPLAISSNTPVTYGEAYTTTAGRKCLESANALGRQVSRVRNWVGGLKPMRSYREKVAARLKAQRAEVRAEEKRVEEWLKENIPSQNKEFIEQCLILVDPVCELRARRGQRPEVEVEEQAI